LPRSNSGNSEGLPDGEESSNRTAEFSVNTTKVPGLCRTNCVLGSTNKVIGAAADSNSGHAAGAEEPLCPQPAASMRRAGNEDSARGARPSRMSRGKPAQVTKARAKGGEK
jgi:hypothetical protein